MTRTRRHSQRSVRWPRFLSILLSLGVLGLLGYHVFSQQRLAHAIGSNSEPPVAITPASRPPRQSEPSQSPSVKPAPRAYFMSVPAQSQFPQLPNGCEVTSLSMLLSAVGHPVSKMTLAAEMPKAPTPLKLAIYTNSQGQTVHKVTYWGNPNVGFVGSVYTAGEGYGIYNGPMMHLLSNVLPGRAENLTNHPFSQILDHVGHGIPVEVWTTLTFKPTTDWVSWNSPQGVVRATPLEHAVLIVGYNATQLFINNPWTGQAGERIAKAPFIAAWQQLGRQAITVTAMPK